MMQSNPVETEASLFMDELADFDEEMEPVETLQDKSALKRRKRMVIDLEDDDE